MSDILPVARSCSLNDYGVRDATVDAIFEDIVKWLSGDGLVWNQTKYINSYTGPNGRTVIELLCFHYDGPSGREVGSGGEDNYCRLYLYDDRVAISFNADNGEESCGITFRYSTSWAETDRGLLKFISDYLNSHLTTLFNSDPIKFRGDNELVEAAKNVILIADGVMHNQIVM